MYVGQSYESLQPELSEAEMADISQQMNMEGIVIRQMVTDKTEAYRVDNSDMQRTESNWGYYYRVGLLRKL